MMRKRKVLMVCLGNSCRSPMAEAVFQDQVRKMDSTDLWEVESAAILDYHVGNGPEPRAVSTLQKAGITDYSHIARQITPNDFYKFDWIFGMDEYNIHLLYEMQPKDSQAKIELLGKYDPTGMTVIRDPLFTRQRTKSRERLLYTTLFSALRIVRCHQPYSRKDAGSAGFEKAFQQALRSVRAFLEINKDNTLDKPQ